MTEENKLVGHFKSRESLLMEESEEAKETVQKLVNETTRLDIILSIRKELNEKICLGFLGETTTPFGLKTTFVK